MSLISEYIYSIHFVSLYFHVELAIVEFNREPGTTSLIEYALFSSMSLCYERSISVGTLQDVFNGVYIEIV